MATTKRTRQEVAAFLRRFLAMVDRGELLAEDPVSRRIMRRVEGAVAALEADRRGAGDDQ
jgi:hypothetical protein